MKNTGSNTTLAVLSEMTLLVTQRLLLNDREQNYEEKHHNK
jgi:hypothetical protein